MAVVVREVAQKRVPEGTVVDVRVAGRTVRATVLEDLGPIGPHGWHVVRLAAQLDPEDDETTTFDMSIDVESLSL